MTEFIREAAATQNRFVLRVAGVAAIGGFLFGYDTGVIGGALLYVKHDLHAGSNFDQQAIVASLLVGAVAGALAAGRLADLLGRRRTIIAAAWLYVAGGIGSALAQSVWQLVGARLVLGLAVGAVSFVAPMYISEIAPSRIRGGTVTLNQLMLASGILAAYIADWGLKGLPGNWRWMVGLAAAPGLALAIGMLFVPESPRWLVEQGRYDDARRVLCRIRGKDDVDDELHEIEQAAKHKAGHRALLQPQLRPMLIVGVGLAAFQQLVGINTVIYYAPDLSLDIVRSGMDVSSGRGTLSDAPRSREALLVLFMESAGFTRPIRLSTLLFGVLLRASYTLRIDAEAYSRGFRPPCRDGRRCYRDECLRSTEGGDNQVGCGSDGNRNQLDTAILRRR